MATANGIETKANNGKTGSGLVLFCVLAVVAGGCMFGAAFVKHQLGARGEHAAVTQEESSGLISDMTRKKVKAGASFSC